MASILKVDTIQDQSGNNIINESGDTITIGASGDTINIVGTLQNNGSALAGGITEADQFRLTTNLTGDQDPISSLERVNESYFAKIGTGMTESSGIFSFPSTGLYLIMFQATNKIFSDVAGFSFRVSTDSGSNYDIYASGNAEIVSGTTSRSEFLQGFINVTDVSTFRVKFVTNSFGSNVILGSTTQNRTVMSFIRLGDSQ